MVNKESQATHRNNQELHPKGVVVAVICGLEFEEEEIDGDEGWSDEENFHGSVVDRYKGGEQVQVPGDEN